jgi:hypothetical protein
VWFRNTGVAVLHHQDPLLALPRYEWNFLPAMPYVYALKLSTGLPWELAGKICPVLANLVTTVLVGSLAAPERAARVRWQYAGASPDPGWTPTSAWAWSPCWSPWDWSCWSSGRAWTASS